VGDLARWCLHQDADGALDCGEFFLANAPASKLALCEKHRKRVRAPIEEKLVEEPRKC
jgi:hypothetical protein